MDKPVYSFVIPIYNEEETLPEFYSQVSKLLDKMDGPAEVILIDDGSRDNSYTLMLNINRLDGRFKVLQLSRNFGHQTAITAGMDVTVGDVIIIMDADLQDPPEVVLEMVAKWREGYEIVYGVREEREGESWFKRLSAAMFYRLLRKLTDLDIPVDVGDFRLVDRSAMEAFKSLREHSRYVRGMFSWIGFKQTGVRYTRHERFAGTTKYPFKKMLKLAIDGIVSFSTLPLRLALQCGFYVAAGSFAAGVVALVLRLAGSHLVPGWASLVFVVSFLGGVQLMLIGVLGEYVGRVYDEVRQRPLYIVRASEGVAPEAVARLNNAVFAPVGGGKPTTTKKDDQ